MVVKINDPVPTTCTKIGKVYFGVLDGTSSVIQHGSQLRGKIPKADDIELYKSTFKANKLELCTLGDISRGKVLRSSITKSKPVVHTRTWGFVAGGSGSSPPDEPNLVISEDCGPMGLQFATSISAFCKLLYFGAPDWRVYRRRSVNNAQTDEAILTGFINVTTGRFDSLPDEFTFESPNIVSPGTGDYYELKFQYYLQAGSIEDNMWDDPFDPDNVHDIHDIISCVNPAGDGHPCGL